MVRCGALLRPASDEQARTVAELAARARRATGWRPTLADDGALEVPGESVTDPVAYTLGLASPAAVAGGAEVRAGARVEAIERRGRRGSTLQTADGERVSCAVAVNCAGLRADEVARLAGDESFSIYPRKGEFFVFEPPAASRSSGSCCRCRRKRTKGVLVFPTVDGKVIAGPTAHDQEDKDDWSVRDEALRRGDAARRSRCCRRSRAPSRSPATPACARRAATATT